MDVRPCACHDHHPLKRQAPTPPPETAEAGDPVDFRTGSGFDPANLDRSVRPQDDFYKFAVGGWKKSHPIPDHKMSVGAFDGLAEANRTTLHNILTDLSSRTQVPGSDEQKLADYYASGMDQATIEAAGAKPLQPLFDGIESIDSLAALQTQVARLHSQGVSAFFSFGSSQDLKDSKKIIGETAQGGLGLPERDYYFKSDAKSVEIRQAYQKHIERTFQLLGDSPQAAAAGAQKVMEVETKLAGISLTMEELRDPNKLYNPHNRTQLEQMTPNLNWNQYLAERGLDKLDGLNVATPDYFKGLTKLLGETPLQDLKGYLRWHAIAANSWALSKPFEDENFEFNKVMTGVKTKNDRWKKVVTATEGAMGDALGREFVKQKFPPESKERVLNILHNIRAELHDDLSKLPWMGEATRKEAIQKLDAIREKIGYPDKWTDYSQLQVEKGPFVNNVISANRWAIQQDLNKIGKTVDPTEWGMTPAQVNAYYHPLNNEIVFPAGILQPPFFNPDADEAINYGGIGVVIGHEITHGFDDSGAQFDAQGNLRDWWTPDDKARFQERTQRIINQANDFKVGESHLNGPVVVGEAMADLGGVELAFDAFQRSREGKPATAKIDGFTPEQRFFLGYAQVWASNTRPEAELQQINTDPHPLSEFRVNGTLSNLPEFAEAFGAKEGDPMVRPKATSTLLWE
ncbi:MAG: M13 family metallopeptidase [Candidatus Eremiobacteraeota bacterium]|nr:M13 family metallopeptidase [Candidatus Eremiobacteraeota bacterium]MCW5869952.1 M13 family metallopeptidase [Candidatus Eremiobacteraeota bacterium]